MDSIELDCPSCGVMLEVDRGFAGGVCRCSTCGTLMTVPLQAGGEAESLTRPERPDRPDHPNTPAPASPARSARPDAPTSLHEAPATVGGQTAAETGSVYTTPSGRTVRVNERAAIPTARSRRRKTRILTYAVVAVFALSLVGGAIYAIVLLMSAIDEATPATSDPVDIVEYEPPFEYDFDANPFLLKKANAVGLPLKASTVVVFDLSPGTEEYFALIAPMLAAGAKPLESGASYQVLIARGDTVESIPAKFGDWSEAARSQLESAASRFKPDDAADVVALVEQALAAEPAQLVLITGQRISKEQSEAIARACESHKTMQFNLFALGVNQPEMSSFVREREGESRMLAISRLNTWKRSFDEEAAAP